jgi:hypothetical protein
LLCLGFGPMMPLEARLLGGLYNDRGRTGNNPCRASVSFVGLAMAPSKAKSELHGPKKTDAPPERQAQGWGRSLIRFDPVV